jgi:hypothetical protein
MRHLGTLTVRTQVFGRIIGRGMAMTNVNYADQSLTFFKALHVVWEAPPPAAGTSVGLLSRLRGQESEKLYTGAHVFDFSFDLPTHVRWESGKEYGLREFDMPATFVEQGARGSIFYEMKLKVKRSGTLNTDDLCAVDSTRVWAGADNLSAFASRFHSAPQFARGCSPRNVGLPTKQARRTSQVHRRTWRAGSVSRLLLSEPPSLGSGRWKHNSPYDGILLLPCEDSAHDCSPDVSGQAGLCSAQPTPAFVSADASRSFATLGAASSLASSRSHVRMSKRLTYSLRRAPQSSSSSATCSTLRSSKRSKRIRLPL